MASAGKKRRPPVVYFKFWYDRHGETDWIINTAVPGTPKAFAGAPAGKGRKTSFIECHAPLITWAQPSGEEGKPKAWVAGFGRVYYSRNNTIIEAR